MTPGGIRLVIQQELVGVHPWCSFCPRHYGCFFLVSLLDLPDLKMCLFSERGDWVADEKQLCAVN